MGLVEPGEDPSRVVRRDRHGRIIASAGSPGYRPLRPDQAESAFCSASCRAGSLGHPDGIRQGTFVANIKSQKKRILTNEKARQRNRSVKSALKTAVRRFDAAADAGDTEQAVALAREAGRKLDKAVSKGVIHRNQAANRKSAIDRRAATL